MSMNYPEEATHLEMVEGKLQAELEKLDQSVAGYEQEYLEAKRYLAAYWNELDTMEKFSNERSLMQIENSEKITLDRLAKIEKLILAPYFARIDFKYPDDDETDAVYIGPFSFSDERKDILIHDWRAPVSSMYYDYELGEASYEAPLGTVSGRIERKRQFIIKNGRLENVLESAINIDDDILQKELSSTSDEKMKTIIATIQKEQNQIIRNEQSNVLIIQGVAGSGKTSIALHRAAYLLYRYKEHISADQVAVISPNKVFSDYISNVLPELGEEPMLELSFDQIASAEMTGNLEYERFTERLERFSSAWLERSRFKSTPEFISLLDDYLNDAGNRYFEPKDCMINHFAISAEYVKKRYLTYRSLPIFKRFAEIADNILEEIKADKLRNYPLPSRNELIKKLASMFKMNSALDMYIDFYHHIKSAGLLVFAGRNKLEWPDVFPYLYVKAFIEGIETFPAIKHLVIDEMQDYTPIQYAVIHKMYPCRKTVLGDFGQAVNPYNGLAIHDFKGIFSSVDVVELKKSYRSSYEIIEFAMKILPAQRIDAVKRHGEPPALIQCSSIENELDTIKEQLGRFGEGRYATLGILCKDSRTAKALYLELSGSFRVSLLDSGSSKFENGITITTIFLSKGLEFDEVLLPYVNDQTYSSAYDQSLLYVACTRAMHKLTLVCHGNCTKFLEQ